MRFLTELGGWLRSLGWTADEPTLGAQKRLYLLQAAGAPLPYRFTWDRQGPHSEGAAIDIAELSETLDIGVNTTEFDSNPAVSQVTKIQDACPIDDLVVWLEFVASIHYLARATGTRFVEDVYPAALVDQLLLLKPHLEPLEQHADLAWKCACQVAPSLVS